MKRRYHSKIDFERNMLLAVSNIRLCFVSQQARQMNRKIVIGEYLFIQCVVDFCIGVVCQEFMQLGNRCPNRF